MIVYRIYVHSYYEEDVDSPDYYVDFETREEADIAFDSYAEERTLSGQYAYAVSPPLPYEVYELDCSGDDV